MARSLTFNGIDLSTYNLIVQSLDIPMSLSASAIQLPDKAYAFSSNLPPLTISVRVSVSGTTHNLTRSYVNSIKGVLNEVNDKNLAFDAMTDRYWSARLQDLRGSFTAPMSWQGEIAFVCYDPLAFDTTPTSSNFLINADPKAIIETAGGTATIKPVYSLTSGANITPATIIVENLDVGEALTWVGNIAIGQILSIDCDDWIVELDGVASMSDVSGKFPQLRPGVNNLQVSGFGALGSLVIDYRNRYI